MHKQLINHKEEIVRNYELVSGSKLLYSNKIKIDQALNIPKPNVSSAHFLQLNSKVFTRYPLMLDMLLKGELK